MEAARQLGRETIPVEVLDCTADEAREMEISANLTAGMTPLQDAIFLAEWQMQYEKRHPETAAGIAGALAKHGLQGKSASFAEGEAVQTTNLSFAQVVAESRKISVRHVQRVTAAARALTADERVALHGPEIALPMSDIEKLAKISNAEERQAVVRKLSLGAAKSVGAARSAWRAEFGSTSDTAAAARPKDTSLAALLTALDRAPVAMRKAFLLERCHEVWEAQNKSQSLPAAARDATG